MKTENAITEYRNEIQTGGVVVGKWIRMLYDVLVQGFSENRWFYDERLAKNALGFIHRYCHHYKGVMAPRRMTLELWERAGISSIFGIVDGTGKRPFNQVFWPVGRKQGKTLIAGGIGTYMGYAAGNTAARSITWRRNWNRPTLRTVRWSLTYTRSRNWTRSPRARNTGVW